MFNLYMVMKMPKCKKKRKKKKGGGGKFDDITL